MHGASRDRLGELVGRGGVCVLSGAGLSTESGIPDYRGPSGALRARLPMTIAEFRSSRAARQRYWARAQIGWQRLAAARPNAGHRAVAALQQAGLVRGIITQNVDGLHQAAGARDIVELHGTLDRVVCLECGARSTRDALDERLRAVNSDLAWNVCRGQLRRCAGTFTSGGTVSGAIPATNVATFSGGVWSAVGSGVAATVYGLACRSGKLFASGKLSGAFPVVTEWNGPAWSAVGPGRHLVRQCGARILRDGRGRVRCVLDRRRWRHGAERSRALEQFRVEGLW